MRAIIICGGDVGEYIKDYIKNDDFVICADRGYDYAKKYGIAVDVVLGDMDSVESKYPDNALIYPVRKDFTDSELAVKYAIENGYSELLLFGMTGSRMDHTLANITLLQKLDNAVIINENNEIYFAKKEITLHGVPGDNISIIPYPDSIRGVTTYGLDYPLKDGTIKAGTTLGVSNVMVTNQCKITIEKGTAFIIRSKD